MDGDVFRLASQAEGEVGETGGYQSQCSVGAGRGWGGGERLRVTFHLCFWNDMILGIFSQRFTMCMFVLGTRRKKNGSRVPGVEILS